MEMHQATWKEVQEYLKNQTALLIPVGTCEQHGHHSPLGTDSFVTQTICKEVSERFNLMTAPAIHYGVHFDVDADYPGGASIKPETLKAIMLDLKDCWEAQGFSKFILMSFHGVPDHYKALESLGEPFYLVKASVAPIADILDKQDAMIHSCEAETSVMLHLFPEKISMELAQDGDDLEDFIQHLNDNRRFNIEKYPGNIGFAKSATAEKGKEIYKRLKKEIFIQVEEILNKD